MGAINHVRIAEAFLISFLQARKAGVAGGGTVKGGVKIFAVSFPQGKPDSKTDDCLYAGAGTVINNAFNIFPGVIYEWKQGTEPDDRRNSCVTASLQNLEAAAGGADTGFYDFAECVISSGQRHLNDGLCLFVYPGQDIKVAQYKVRFCYEACAKIVAINYFKTAAHKSKLFFQWNVWVAHGAGSNHTAFAFFTQGLSQQFGRVLLYFNIFKSMGKLIALTAGVAVNTAVGTAAVDVHAVRSQN